MKIYYKRSVFIMLLISYMLVLCFPLLVGSFTYMKTRHAIEDEIYRANTVILEQARQTLDQQMKQVRSLVSEVSLNPRVNNLIHTRLPFDSSTRFNIYNILKDLSVYKSTHPFITDFYIYFESSDMILTPTGSFNPKMFYDYVYSYDNIDYSTWYNTILKGYDKGKFIYSQATGLSNSPNNIVTYSYSLPIIDRYRPLANLIIMLDEQHIVELLENLKWFNKGIIYVIDQNNQLIASTSKETIPSDSMIEKLVNKQDFFHSSNNGKEVVVSYITSEENNWKYVFVMPSELFLSKLIYMKRLMFYTLTITLIIGIILAHLLAYKNYSPINKIIEILSDKFKKVPSKSFNEIEYIHNSILDTLEEGRKLHDAIDAQKLSLQSSFLVRILEGKTLFTDTIKDSLRDFHINFCYPSYNVILLQADNCSDYSEERWSTIRLLITDYLKKFHSLNYQWYVVQIDKQKLAFLLNFEHESAEKYEQKIHIITNHVKEFLITKLESCCTMGVGSVYDKVNAINKSYIEAQRALEYKFVKTNDSVIWYKNVAASCQKFCYPESIEKQVINCIKSGSYKELQDIIKDVFHENIIERSLSLEMIQLLFLNVINTAVKVVDELKIDYLIIFEKDFDPVKMFSSCRNINDACNHLNDVFERLCAYICSTRKDHSTWRVEKILEFIQQQYLNHDLCLSSIAEYFGITPQYLSNIFKEQTGENLMSYIHKLRIEKAKELLNDSSLTIDNIAQLVGYNNYLALVRSFKKYEGITPGMYRHDAVVVQEQS